MNLTDPSTLILIAGIFVIAGLVKGILGMGLPTLAMGLLGLVMAPVSAAALLVVPSAVTNIWQFLAGPQCLAVGRRLASMMLAQVVGVFLTGAWLVSGAAGSVSIALGVVLVIYAMVVLSAFRLTVTQPQEKLFSPIAGLLSGLITGATGIMVIPAAPYLQSLDMDKDSLVQALGLSFTTSTLALLVLLFVAGRFDVSLTWPVFIALAAVCVGMWLGQRLRHGLSPPLFRRLFILGIGCIGVMLIVRNLVV